MLWCMCMHVCLYVCVSRKPAKLIGWSHSFCSWLIWKANSYSCIGCKQFWNIMWPWPIYLAPKWPILRKKRVLAIFDRCVIRTLVISTRLQWISIRKSGMGLSNDTKMSPSTSPNPSFGGRNLKQNSKKSDFGLSHDETLLHSCSDQQLPLAKLFKRQSWKCFESNAYLRIVQRFQCTPWLTQSPCFVSNSCTSHIPPLCAGCVSWSASL